MRPIKIDDLERVFNEIKGEGAFAKWLEEADQHLTKLRKLSWSAKKKYINRHNHWTKLYAALSRLSSDKCWYTEAKENSSEWEVEHYRPKLKSKAEDGSEIRKDGYWWLTFYWKNFRLAGTLVNKIRRDRFRVDSKPYGKGNFFPLDLEDGGEIAQLDDFHCGSEIPYLLDPIIPRDTRFISFDASGTAIENADPINDSFNFKRAELSIYFYGLNHTPIVNGRKQVWDSCHKEVQLAHNYVKKTAKVNRLLKEHFLRTCYERIYFMSREDQPYSSVVHAYLKAKKVEYDWLEELIEVVSK